MNKQKYFYVLPVTAPDGEGWVLQDPKGVQIDSEKHPYDLVRDIMARKAIANDQCIMIDTESGRCYRKERHVMSVDVNQSFAATSEVVEQMADADPVVGFIHRQAVDIRPKDLVMSDLKWKYLVRSALRGKNIMMTGPAGTGKTLAAQSLVKALDRPFFYFNLGATQDPRGTLIGNTHFAKDTGTIFSESVFVKAIQTPDAVILLDELSRAHPEAWNILMTVLDQGQRYLRLDEHKDTLTIPVAAGVTFVATANIGSEYTSTRAMDRALLDRFVILEMDILSREQESALLRAKHPTLASKSADIIAEIAATTRMESMSDNPRVSTAVSTRVCVEMAGLIADGFNLSEAAEVCIYPFYDKSGGLDSERTYIKQLIQKYDINQIQEQPVDTEETASQEISF